LHLQASGKIRRNHGCGRALEAASLRRDCTDDRHGNEKVYSDDRSEAFAQKLAAELSNR
jgi:hypothetical protein